jgi:hypothetical protein
MKVSVIVRMQVIINHTLKTANTSFELEKNQKNLITFTEHHIDTYKKVKFTP